MSNSAISGLLGHGHGLTATYVQRDAELLRLGPDWTALFDRIGCRNVFLSFEWMARWWAHWGQGRRLFVVTVRDEAWRLIGVAPLCVTPSAGEIGPNRLGFLANECVGSDYLDVLVAPDDETSVAAAIAGLVVRHRREWDYVDLSDGNADSIVCAELRRQLRGLGMRESVVRASVCPYTLLPDTFEAYLAELGPNLRYNFRRRLRALEREGPVDLVATSGGIELERGFSELVRLHGLRFNQQRRNSSFLDPGVQAFHADVLPRLAARGWTRLYLLTVRGDPVAALYGFSIGRTFRFYQSGMDPSWSRLSVGLVTMGRAIQEAIRSGHEEFDFLRGDEPYKFQWASSARHTVTSRLFDRRFKSRWALVSSGLGAMTTRAKSTVQRWIGGDGKSPHDRAETESAGAANGVPEGRV